MTPVLKVGERAVFRSTAPGAASPGRDGQTVTVVGSAPARPYGTDGRTAVQWTDGERTWALTRCLSPVTRSTVDEGDLRAVAIGLGMTATNVETLLTLTALVSAARAS